jgi:hypothetical protein
MYLTRSGIDDGLPVRFSPNGQWAAGVAQDQAVYVWSLAALPNQVLVASLPGPEREQRQYTPMVNFSPQGNYLVDRATEGSFYAWKVESQPDLSKPITHPTAQSLTAVCTADGRSLFLLGGNSLEWGDLGEPLWEVMRADHEIQDIAITPRGDKLIVLGSRHLTVVRRRFYCWGLPVWDRTWPAVQDRE